MQRLHRSDVLALLGRILLSAIFLVGAVAKIHDWTPTYNMMAQKGIPFVSLFLGAAIIFELLGGLSVLFGVVSRVGALVLFLYLIPVTLIMHNFWAVSPDNVNVQLVNFMKNLAVMGGLLLLAGFGPGRLSLQPNDEDIYDRDRIQKRSEVKIRSGL